MRISLIEGDSGYNTWQDLSKAVVTLDGEVVKNCLTADEMLGFVLVDDGYELVGSNFTKFSWRPKTKKLHGVVRITFKWD